MTTSAANESDPKGLVALESKLIGQLYARGIPEGTTNAQLYKQIGYPDPPAWRYPPGILEFAQYLIYFSVKGDELEALCHAGLTMTSVERRCKIDKGFERMRKEAKRIARSFTRARLESAAVDRAINGVDKNIYYLGDVCGTEKVYSDGLLSKLLDRCDAQDSKDIETSKDPNTMGGHEVESATRQIFRKLLGGEEDGGMDVADAAIEEDSSNRVAEQQSEELW